MMNIEKVFYIIISTILLTIFILFTFVFTTGDLDSQSPSKIKTIYFVDHISSAHQKVIDIFNEKYKGSIKVETINLSFEKFSTNDRKELLARYLRSRNDRIDIFSVDQIWVPRFARWAVPLQNYLSSEEIGNIIPNALQTCIYKDTLVAVPLYIDIAVMYYRDDLLKTLPDKAKIINELENSITWERFINLSRRVNRDKRPFYIFQADDYEGLVCSFVELMANQNNPIFDINGKILINSAEGRKSLQFLVDLVNKYRVSPKDVTYLKENESFRFFAKNDGMFLRSWSSMIDDKVEFLTAKMRSNLKVAPLPHFENSRPALVYGGWNLMISQFSERIPEVVKFVKYLLSEESQRIMYEEGGYLPTNRGLYDIVEVKKYEELKYFERLYKIGFHRPFMEGYTNVSDILSYYLHKAIKGELTVEKALEEAERKIREKEILVK